ncbi:hypothetical protein M1M30_gp021 [Maribacter phage Colly_1]|uniref:Uncharacterized protein n=1 Tax=Maribacter phage Colly_1 TaxID=2745691 RepID=A0A8E4XY00_9CAUD|nr:hypothetical protein M1M30_gp021 [Maribacter phage Colly_1]QQO97302.1 hypothetical protein Colly1_21 [Maribacter phage Colly_1]
MNLLLKKYLEDKKIEFSPEGTVTLTEEGLDSLVAGFTSLERLNRHAFFGMAHIELIDLTKVDTPKAMAKFVRDVEMKLSIDWEIVDREKEIFLSNVKSVGNIYTWRNLLILDYNGYIGIEQAR